jgi:adenosylmethionine-8-amino-7-oxononanoate aminotransferase
LLEASMVRDSVRICQTMQSMTNASSLFPRNFRKEYPVAIRGEGCWIFSADGKRFLDAAGQAAVVSIGHGVKEIGRAMAAQSSEIAFAHTSQFHSEPAEKLAARLLRLAPANFQNGGRVVLTSGGSEAAETAIKLARQYQIELGQAQRYGVASREQSYHGSTLGAMSVSGNVARRAPYQPLITEWGHIAPCFSYHKPASMSDLSDGEYGVAAANELEKFLRGPGGKSTAAFIFEPVVGATLGAAVASDGYAMRIAEICREYGILLIADEVMCGMGRTGRSFAIQHWNVDPDIILVGKGIASGYAPLGAVLVSARVAEAFERGSGVFQHGFTYQAHPVATAAGNAVLDYLETNKLFARVTPASEILRKDLAALLEHPHVGDVRGLGLLIGVEFVKNKQTREPFAPSENIAERIRQGALVKGVLSYPTQGCVDGLRGDHVLLAPPFILTDKESATIAGALQSALENVFRK